MSDPVASLHERVDVVTAALEQWTGQPAAPDQAAARRAGSAAERDEQRPLARSMGRHQR